jgi:hypothetical protein
MRTGTDQRSRGRFNANRPSHQQPRGPQSNQTLDSRGPGERIRGTASQISERYLTLAREASRSDDRVAAEGYYQHAEHYFRAGRDADPAGTSRPTGPATVETGVASAEPSETDAGYAPPGSGDAQPGP